ncbi:hypothetical protein RHECNPAF_470053 [Rhizobium etli CNPAF512]|nr:hypothetical protein RHECNPAF_470053 [Rhizobium etli CNPAF512]
MWSSFQPSGSWPHRPSFEDQIISVRSVVSLIADNPRCGISTLDRGPAASGAAVALNEGRNGRCDGFAMGASE